MKETLGLHSASIKVYVMSTAHSDLDVSGILEQNSLSPSSPLSILLKIPAKQFQVENSAELDSAALKWFR